MSAATAEVVPLALAGDQVGVAPLSDTDLARGPPVATLANIAEVETASSALAADIVGAATAEVLPLPLAGEQVGVAPFSDLDMARGPPVATPAARGPPSADYLLADASSPFASAPAALSTADLQSLADLALAIWSDALAAQGLSLPAGAPSFLIADLADGILGQTDGSTITLDLDAAGHGWFVDATPRDAVEFSLYLGTDHLGAVPGSAAAGAMDLLTVLLHEIGHWAGYDHDAGIALMAPVLGTGQRVVLDLGDAAPAAGGSVPGLVEAALTASPTLDLSAGQQCRTITIPVNADGTLGISGTASRQRYERRGCHEHRRQSPGTDHPRRPERRQCLDARRSKLRHLEGGSLADHVHPRRVPSPVARTMIASWSSNGATGLTSFDGEGGFDSVVNQAGAAGTTFGGVENFIDRPLLFIPGFGGSFVDTTLPDDSMGTMPWTQWYLTRGIDPTKLVVDPLTEAYSDFVQTLVNAGYTDGTNKAGVDGTLYVSLWDWRVPVAVTSDGADDGVLSDVTASFDSRLGDPTASIPGSTTLPIGWTRRRRLGHNLTGANATAVDVITHSTGGLVARAYLQSAAYDHPADNLLPVNTLIQTGVPNQGMGGAIAILANDFSMNAAARAGGNLINTAYELLLAGATISNPDGTTISKLPTLPTELEFISQYVATFNNLLAVYPFLDTTDDGDAADLVAVAAADGGNTLLLDLNAIGPARLRRHGEHDVRCLQ